MRRLLLSGSLLLAGLMTLNLYLWQRHVQQACPAATFLLPGVGYHGFVSRGPDLDAPSRGARRLFCLAKVRAMQEDRRGERLYLHLAQLLTSSTGDRALIGVHLEVSRLGAQPTPAALRAASARSLALAGQSGDPGLVAELLAHDANLRIRENYPASLARLLQALALARQINNRDLERQMLEAVALGYTAGGERDKALDYLAQYADQAGTTREQYRIGMEYLLLITRAGQTAWRRPVLEQLLLRLQRDVARDERVHRPVKSQAYGWLYVADVAARLDRREEAADAFDAAKRLFTRANDVRGLALVQALREALVRQRPSGHRT